MNVASLTNCKRLYELSEWNDTEFYWSVYFENHEEVPGEETLVFRNGLELKYGYHRFPAYDSGYLLRKLPNQSGLMKLDAGYLAVSDPTEEDLANPELQNKYLADTPEDALCLLAIKLIEEGILEATDPQQSTKGSKRTTDQGES